MNHPLDDGPTHEPEPEEVHERRFMRIREQLSSARARQFGLFGIFLVMAVTAVVLVIVRGSKNFTGGVLAPLAVFMGFAVSVSGGILLISSARQYYLKQRRLAALFLRYGIVCLLVGIPGGIGLAVAMVMLSRM